jgi:hypothetical protein
LAGAGLRQSEQKQACLAAPPRTQLSTAGRAALLPSTPPPQEVEAALLEAADNVRFLAPLRRYLEKLSAIDDFVALVGRRGRVTGAVSSGLQVLAGTA